jgi:transcriptional regulator with XRE-family HTH domain
MGKVRAESNKLGNDLKRHRKEQGMTQAEFAAKAGVGERTVWLMEEGKGGLDSFRQALRALGLSLFCRNGTGELPELIQTLRVPPRWLRKYPLSPGSSRWDVPQAA